MDDDLLDITEVDEVPFRVRLMVTGELDAYTAPTLEAETVRRLTHGICEVVLDLAGVGFIDSGGLTFLVRVWKRTESTGVTLRVIVRRGFVERIINIAGLDGFMPITAVAADA